MHYLHMQVLHLVKEKKELPFQIKDPLNITKRLSSIADLQVLLQRTLKRGRESVYHILMTIDSAPPVPICTKHTPFPPGCIYGFLFSLILMAICYLQPQEQFASEYQPQRSNSGRAVCFSLLLVVFTETTSGKQGA